MIACWLCSSLQLVLLCCIAGLQYLATSRAGFARHVTARSVQLERMYDMQLVVRVVAFVVVALCMFALGVLIWRKRPLRLVMRIEAALLVVLCAAFLFVAFALSRGELRAYYYLLAAFLPIVCLQAGKCLLAQKPSSTSMKNDESSPPRA